MRCAIVLLIASVLFAQEPILLAQEPTDAGKLVVPAGTKVPVSLKSGISTKRAKVGDSVYAQTIFPIAINNNLLIPAGTFVQGTIKSIQRPGRVKGRAEVLFHFTTLVYPNGYTVLLPGAVENIDTEHAWVKGEEGTVQQEGQKGRDVGTVASTGATGALVGAAAGGGKGALIGAGAGGGVGLLVSMLTRGDDVRIDPGTTVEMIIQRPVTVDASRIGH